MVPNLFDCFRLYATRDRLKKAIAVIGLRKNARIMKHFFVNRRKMLQFGKILILSNCLLF